MTRNTVFALFALAGLTLSLASAPLTAQSTQPSTQPAAAGQAQVTSAKKAKSKKVKANNSSAVSNIASSSSTKNSSVPAATKVAESSTSAATPQKGMVWVNTASGVYHREGTKYYGKTKQGKYMTESDAQKAGYHAAKDGTKP